MIVVGAAVEQLLQLHLDHRQTQRLMQLDRVDGIEHHAVLIGARGSGAPLKIEGRATAHQHLAAPNLRRSRAKAVQHRCRAMGWVDGDQHVAVGHRTGPIGLWIGLQLPALRVSQIPLDQLQGAPLQAAHHQALRQRTTLARFPQQ